jgi:hypothetical protein
MKMTMLRTAGKAQDRKSALRRRWSVRLTKKEWKAHAHPCPERRLTNKFRETHSTK